MNKINSNKLLEENLRDTKHNKKANNVFNKLLAQQKKQKNPFDEIRSYSPPQTNSKPGGNIDVTD